MKKQKVVAALIWREDQFLICQRPEGKRLENLWEFVGGKVDEGESLEQSLIRECREELDVEITVGDLFLEVEHEYPFGIVQLYLFEASLAHGEPKMIEHQDIRWIAPDEIDEYEFCPADGEILERIKSEHSKRK